MTTSVLRAAATAKKAPFTASAIPRERTIAVTAHEPPGPTGSRRRPPLPGRRRGGRRADACRDARSRPPRRGRAAQSVRAGAARRSVPRAARRPCSRRRRAVRPWSRPRGGVWRCGVSAPRKRIRQPCERSTRPNAISPMSCRSPGAQARIASGPPPRPHRRARASNRSRTRLLAKCSCPISSAPALPLRADLAQHRENEVAQDGLEREPSEYLVENRVHRRLVVRVCGGDEALAGGVERTLRGALLRERAAGRLCGREALGECSLHALDPLGVSVRIETKAALGSDRLQQLVAALPGPEQFRADADTARELADPQASGSDAHSVIIHLLDKRLTQ